MENRVFLAECRTYAQSEADQAVRRVLGGLGYADKSKYRGKSVVVKANLLNAFKPDTATTTHPSVISAAASFFVEAGAKVTILDSPGGAYTPSALKNIYRVTGMTDAAESSGASLNFDMSTQKVRTKKNALLKELEIISPIMEADLVVNVAKLKTHGLAYYTGAVKNMFGAVPGLVKAAYHSRFPDTAKFNRFIVDVCETVRPHISIIDGVVGMEGPGPSGGIPKEVGVIGGSINPYALDLAMCEIVSLPYKMVPILMVGIKRGLAPAGPDKLVYLGDSPKQFKTKFEAAVSGNTIGIGYFALKALPKGWRDYVLDRRSPWPVMLKNCIACGKCVEICPRQVISIVDRLAVPDYTGCIRCYCCHEVCPVQAIDLKRIRVRK